MPSVPTQVWYSAGYRNRFDFPRQEVVERVAAAGAQQANTAELGAISLLFSSEGVGQRVFARDVERRWWHETEGSPSSD